MQLVADPRPARTRQRLIAAGHSLIAEKGVSNLRIAELTSQAGVALGSFQNHFASKDELVEAVVEEVLQTLAAEIVDAPDAREDEPAAVAIAALRRFVRLAYDDPAFCRLLVNLSRGAELFVEAIRPYAETALERAVQAGAFEIEDMDIAVTSIVAGALAVIRRILDGRLGADADIPLARMTLLGLGVDSAGARRLSRLPLSDGH
jgi:AcrR family transcriptional regulator